ncbi:MAG: hypothetical protein P1U56_25495 [Saprospiraceae bacterium]|nr:hypothetical protein [Saprospiraceae bacterium]
MSESHKKEKGHLRKNWIFYASILAAIGLAGFLWVSKGIALKKQVKTFETEKAKIVEDAKSTLLTNTNGHLELTMKTFVWAVRSEITRGNQEQVDQYFNQLVKSEKVEEIILVDTNGKVLISTNKKNEGIKLETDYAEDVSKVKEVTIINKTDQQVVAAPVLSIDSRVGTLIVLYNNDVFQLDTKQQ